jgi:endonuclease YncB( thermonuclease family)
MFAWRLVQRGSLAARDIQIIDADTIRTRERGRVRFKHCDAPEWYMPGGVPAAQRLRDLIGGAKELRLDYDNPPECDPWGRTIGTLRIDGEDACVILIREGHAKEYKARKRPACKQ